ncbi:hypothetical protein Daus18300_009358 [Diaporthe australafricana]|uniref:Uncharacterized protein n=1 Tax=Diaporthe australafricana TaxID=127596 RepID=A0ABR3WF35_9PEZI
MLEEEQHEYECGDEDVEEDGMGEGGSLGDQDTEEEDGVSVSDQVYERSKECLSTRQSSLDRFDDPTMGHCSVNKTPSPPPSASPPVAATDALAQHDTNSQDSDGQADLVNVAPVNTTSFATADANAVADASASVEYAPLRRRSPPEHTPPATWVWSSFVPNKRPRLNSHCSGVSPSTGRVGQLVGNDAQVDLENNDHDTATTHRHPADVSPERSPSQQHLRPEDPLLALDNEELSVVAPAVTAFRQQSMRLDKFAAELKATISGQRALNAGYRRNIVQAGEEFNKASILLKILRQRLASAQTTMEHRASIQESLQHSLDYITDTDATDTKADSLRSIINSHKDTNNQMEAEVAQIENALASIQDNCTFFERDRATAVDRHAQGLEMLDTTIAQYKAAVDKKRDWDSWITSIHMRPERLSIVSQVQQEAGL